MAQKDHRALTVEDGWLYFLFGWTMVIAEVLHIPIEGPVFDRRAGIAEELHPALVYKPR
jgi:hypothetical protein